MTAAVEVHALTKSFQGLWSRPQHALKGLTLSIPRGVAFGLIGPNGAGKTTFIKLLLGVARPTSGSVRVLGGDPDDRAVRARIGYLPERLHLPAALTAKDVLRSVAVLKLTDASDAVLRPLLERVGLEDSSQRVGTFSKGMRQRLGLATAVLGAPELLILDEPTDGIDPMGRVDVRALLIEEKNRGATILLNSHLLAETERVCDRIGILDHGELKLEGSLDEVRRASSRWFVRVAEDSNSAAVEAAGLVREGNGWAFSGPVEQLNQAIDRLRAAGVTLTELVPATRDLEAVLTETIAAGNAAP
jgi:ABC-2 type transport system ATP-binding protein